MRNPVLLPGFGLSLGVTVLWAGLIVFIPLAGMIINTGSMGWSRFLAEATDPRVLAAFRVSLGGAFVAACINLVFGLLVAWVLVRYRFPGHRFIDALVDLPFALPTAVAGIALSTLYAGNGWVGSWLGLAGIKVAYTPLGVVTAMTFVGLPFVVRTVQPVLQELPVEEEEAAVSLGANRWQVFRWVILPGILPALVTGFALSFARGVGEYGSVIFIAGNMPLVSEIVPLLIVIKLEQFDFAGATAIGTLMLLVTFVLLLLINLLQRWVRSSHA